MCWVGTCSRIKLKYADDILQQQWARLSHFNLKCHFGNVKSAHAQFYNWNQFSNQCQMSFSDKCRRMVAAVQHLLQLSLVPARWNDIRNKKLSWCWQTRVTRQSRSPNMEPFHIPFHSNLLQDSRTNLNFAKRASVTLSLQSGTTYLNQSSQIWPSALEHSSRV